MWTLLEIIVPFRLKITFLSLTWISTLVSLSINLSTSVKFLAGTVTLKDTFCWISISLVAKRYESVAVKYNFLFSALILTPVKIGLVSLSLAANAVCDIAVFRSSEEIVNVAPSGLKSIFG